MVGAWQHPGIALEELRVLHLGLKAARRRLGFHIGWSLGIGDLKAHPQIDTLPSTRPHLLIVPFSMGQAFKPMTLWGLFLFTPAQLCLRSDRIQSWPSSGDVLRYSTTWMRCLAYL